MAVAAFLLVGALIYFLSLPVAEVAVVRRGTAISAIYGTVRIEPTNVDPSSSAECGLYSTGWRSFGRTRCNREERGERRLAGHDCR